MTFALAGVVGAAIGSTLGKLVDGQRLLFLFALAMIAVGVVMLCPHVAAGNADVRITAWMAVRLTAIGLLVGAVSGFFGIGGGFLIVPGLMLATGMRPNERHCHRTSDEGDEFPPRHVLPPQAGATPYHIVERGMRCASQENRRLMTGMGHLRVRRETGKE